MKLISCHIENFGKLHDHSVDFSEGLNTICEENGWGKTTFAAFIRAMFYGLEGERKRSVEENERKRYKPWQGGVFGGQLVFEIKGNEYQISRIFGDKEANDEFELRNMRTNLLSKDYSNKIGEEIFKINRESFMRTIFIGQNACETSATDDINAKIGNLVDSGGDLGNFDSANASLTALINSLTPNRATGSLSKLRNEITRYERIVQDGQGLSDALDDCRSRLAAGEEKYSALKEKRIEAGAVQDKVSRQQSLIAKKSELMRLHDTVEERTHQVDAIRVKFPGEVPEPDEIKQELFSCSEMDKAHERVVLYQMSDEENEELSSLENIFADGIPEESDIDAKIKEASRLRTLGLELNAEKMSALQASIEEQKQQVKQPKNPPILLIIGIIAIVLGMILAVIVTPATVGIAVVSLGAVLLAVVFIGNKKEADNTQPKDLHDANAGSLDHSLAEQKEAESEALGKSISSFLMKYGMASEPDIFSDDLYALKTNASTFASLTEKKKNLDAAEAEYQKHHDEIMTFLEDYGYEAENDLYGQLNDIRDNVAEYLNAVKIKINAVAQLKHFEEDNDVAEFNELHIDEELPSLEAVSQTIHKLTDDIDDAQKSISDYNKQLADLQEKYDEWEEDRIKLEELKESQSVEQKKYKYVCAAKEKLSLAKETMMAKYTDPILKGFGRYYKMISGLAADNYHLDANTAVTVDEMGKQREVDTLSSGYRDLIGIALRLSLVDAMYQDESPMIIMDDPFTNLDDQKIAAGKHFIEEIAEKYQIIYFTCSSYRNL